MATMNRENEIKLSDLSTEMEVELNEILGLITAQKLLTTAIDERLVLLADAVANMQRALNADKP